LREAQADVVIAALGVKDAANHILLCEAAAAVGVTRFIPADFGSLDARDSIAQEMLPLFRRKVQIRQRLEELAAQSDDKFTWTSVVCGHLFDWGLKNGFLHVDLKERTVELLDEGESKFSVSTLARVAEAVLATLRKPDETANRVLMVESFIVSQQGVHKSLEKVSGRQWTTAKRVSKPYIAELKKKVDEDDQQAIEDLVYVLGVVDGNWERRPDFAMGLLGLETQDLDEVIREVLAGE
jgi:hypothetical protein